MKQKLDGFINKYAFLFLALIILITISRLVILFANYKQGHHSDESWTYGFANSYYDPNVYEECNNVLGETLGTKNYNTWVSGTVFKDYVVVNEGEQFKYSSVIYNQLNDLSPALYAMLLHTVCSFFPGKFSWWFGFGINLLCYLFIEILIYLVTFNLSNNKIFSLFMSLYYGLSRAALDTILYIRMYVLLTLITLLLIYLVQRIIKKGYKQCSIEQYLIILLVVLGGLTHFYGLVFDFFFALTFSLLLLIKKEGKHCLTIGIPFLLGAILYVIIYPFGIIKMMSGSNIYSLEHFYPYRIELELMINFLFRDCFGINYSYDVFDLLDTVVIILVLFLIWLVCHFIFRKDQWMIKIIRKEKIILNDAIHFSHIKRAYNFIIKHTCFSEVLMLASLFTTLIVVKYSDVSTMQYYSDRYLFMILPIIEIVSIYLLFYILKLIYIKIKNKVKSNILVQNIPNIIFITITTIFTILNILGPQVYYFTQSSSNFNLEEFLRNKNVIILDDTPWHLEWYSTEVYNSSNVFMASDKYTEDTINNITSLKSNDEYVVILTKSTGMFSINLGDNSNTSNSVAQKKANNAKEFLNEISQDLNLTPNYVISLDTFCGDVDIYSLSK